MIDTDKYEGHTKGDNEVGWRINNNFVSNGKIPNDRYIAYVQPNEDGDKVIEFSNADANLIADAPLLLQEVKRLREELDKAEQKEIKFAGALSIALEHLGYLDADHDEFCKEQYECNVFGDELLKCDNIGCGGFLVDRYGDYVSTISLSESVGCKDEDCCNYYKGSEEE